MQYLLALLMLLVCAGVIVQFKTPEKEVSMNILDNFRIRDELIKYESEAKVKAKGYRPQSGMVFNEKYYFIDHDSVYALVDDEIMNQERVIKCCSY